MAGVSLKELVKYMYLLSKFHVAVHLPHSTAKASWWSTAQNYNTMSCIVQAPYNANHNYRMKN